MKVVVDNLVMVELRVETRKKGSVGDKQNAGECTDLLSSPAGVMSVVVKRHGRVEGRESLKALVRVSMKYPPQWSAPKMHRAECTPQRLLML
jgi:hypothetical protein